MPDLNLPWRPKFVFGTTTVFLDYPMQPFTYGARTIGKLQYTANGVPGANVAMRKYLLNVTLRFTEAEWEDVKVFLAYAQHGEVFTWQPDGANDDGEVFSCYLENPRIADAISPARDGSLIWLMTLPITLSRTDQPWDLEYFLVVTGPDIPTTKGTQYQVTVSDDAPDADTDITVTARLRDVSGNPVHEAGHMVTWESTSTGAPGSFLMPTSTTNGSGIATNTFHTSVDGETIHTITATDEFLTTGTSDPFETNEVIITFGTKYIVTASNYSVAPSGTTTISAQLVDDTDTPIAESGHIVTWSKTGTGGSFANPTSTTDGTGLATIVFTVSSTLDTVHEVTAVDENLLTGTSPDIFAAADGLTVPRAIGNCEFLLDAISGMTGAAGVLTAISDKSGHARTVAPSFGYGSSFTPRYSGVMWDSTHPAMEIQGNNFQLLAFTLPAINQPYTIVLVCDAMDNGGIPSGPPGHYMYDVGNTNQGGGHAAIYTNSGAKYGFATGTPGTNAQTDNVAVASTDGKRIHFHAYDGTSSFMFRGTQNCFTSPPNPGTTAIHGGTVNAIGGRGDAAQMIGHLTVAAFIVYSKKLTSQNMIDLQAFYTARYPGINAA